MCSNFNFEDGVFKDILLKNNCVCILKSFISNWAPSMWNIDSLSQDTLGQIVTVKIGSPYNGGRVPKETECSFEEWDLGKFFEFIKGYQDNNKFYYAGYTHFIHLNETQKNFRSFDWSWAGLSNKDSLDSSLWAGSAGSFTPCHKDSYGCNLHAQLIGHKEWFLWPPKFNLCPTRFPYEESSIFSKVDVLEKQYTDAAIHIVASPGDVIFIPKHWWHLARNLDNSVSINTWIDLPSDALDRLKESITRLLVCSLKKNDRTNIWKNPGEDTGTLEENAVLVEQSLSNLEYENLPCSDSRHHSNYKIVRKQVDCSISFENVQFTDFSHAEMAESKTENVDSVVDSLLNCIVANENTMNDIVSNFLKCRKRNTL